MEEDRIILFSCGNFEKEFLREIVLVVEREYQTPVITEEHHFELNAFYNPARRQYDADRLITHIRQLNSTANARVVGLFRVDLYIPILTYIFGQAILGDQVAIASTFRLRNELYGLKQDDALLLARTVKEVLHELGHTYGLVHCQTVTCVMRSSTYVEEIDMKGASLCARCKSLMQTEGVRRSPILP